MAACAILIFLEVSPTQFENRPGVGWNGPYHQLRRIKTFTETIVCFGDQSTYCFVNASLYISSEDVDVSRHHFAVAD